AIDAVGGLSYSGAAGWTFDIALDARLVVDVADDVSFSVPLSDLAANRDGPVIPAQDIHDGSILGLNLPPFDLLGLMLKPPALRTLAPPTIKWYDGDLATVDVSGFEPEFDFAIWIEDFALAPIDGLSIYSARIIDGIVHA